MNIHEFRKEIDKIDDSLKDYEDKNIVVALAKGSGIGGTNCTDVTRISTGIDWDAGKVMLHTKDRISKAEEIVHDCNVCSSFKKCYKSAENNMIVRCLYFDKEKIIKMYNQSLEK